VDGNLSRGLGNVISKKGNKIIVLQILWASCISLVDVA
jgi:hypothetical protein